jgi:TRAP-type C4-dicarboxylate transport system permease large subunit
LCAWRRALNRKSLLDALSQTLRTTGMIYVVIIGALIFSVFMSVTGLAAQVEALMASIGGGTLMAVIVMTFILLLLGSVLDGLALMLLTTPILLPIIIKLGLSPIWFGVYLVRTMEIGFVHPPIGINLYVIQGIAKDTPLTRIFKGVVPFLAADFLHLSLLIAVPALALALPEWLGQ